MRPRSGTTNVDTTDTPADGEVLTFDSATGVANWQAGGVTLSGVKAVLDTDQVITNNTSTTISFSAAASTERFDDDDYHDPNTDPEKFFLGAGRWLVIGSVFWEQVGTSGDRRISVQRLDSGDVAQDGKSSRAESTSSGVTGNEQTVVAIFEMDAGDYVRMRVFHLHGSDLDVVAFSDSNSSITCIKLD